MPVRRNPDTDQIQPAFRQDEGSSRTGGVPQLDINAGCRQQLTGLLEFAQLVPGKSVILAILHIGEMRAGTLQLHPLQTLHVTGEINDIIDADTLPVSAHLDL